MPTGVIVFDFDPFLRLTDDLAVRWQTVALAAAIALSLGLAGAAARRAGLRPDDLLFIAIGAVPGAVVAGRIAYALAHLDVFGADPLRLLDPAAGGSDLAGGVVGGILAGGYVAALLGAPLGRWAHLASAPLLLGLGAGKLAMVLGGSGQGSLSSLSWATSYAGPGPWGSLAAGLPSHPSQAYEGLAALVIAAAAGILSTRIAPGRRGGRLLLAAVGAWALVRAVVALTWRDPVLVGPLGAAGALSGVIGLTAAGLLVAAVLLGRRGPAPSPS